MKSTKDFRGKTHDFSAEDLLRKAAKLEPIKKSGKERHALFSQLKEDDEESELRAMRRDSILDYYDDGEETLDEELDEDEEFDEDDEFEDELEEKEEEEEEEER